MPSSYTAVIAHASNRVKYEMNRNEGSHWGYLLYQKHRRMAGSDLQARKTCMTLPEFFPPPTLSLVLFSDTEKQNKTQRQQI